MDHKELPFHESPSVGQGERSHLTGLQGMDQQQLHQCNDQCESACNKGSQQCDGNSWTEICKQKVCEYTETAKGAARKAEGYIRGDERLKQGQEPSSLEKAGEWVSETLAEGAKKVGLIKENDQ